MAVDPDHLFVVLGGHRPVAGTGASRPGRQRQRRLAKPACLRQHGTHLRRNQTPIRISTMGSIAPTASGSSTLANPARRRSSTWASSRARATSSRSRVPAASIFPGVRPHLSPSPSGSVCARPGARWNMRAAGFTVVVRPQHLPWARPRGADARPTPPLALLPWERVRGARRGRPRGNGRMGGALQRRSLRIPSPDVLGKPGDHLVVEAGPFTHPVEAPEAIRQAFVGPTRVYRVGAALTSCMAPGRWSSAGWGHTMAMRWLPVGRSSSLGSPMK